MSETIGGTDAPPFVRAVAVLQEKWALLIVGALLEGPAGFNELSRKVSGVCPATLSQRLTLLEEAKLISKTVQSTMPPRTSYTLTASGEDLRPVVDAMRDWAKKHLDSRQPCPLLSVEHS
jgi:DNA-binding HxlR family transcriptional regulator